MQAYFLTLTILIICSSKNLHQKGNFSEMAGSLGYPVEFHQATTPDGYILGLFRIRGPKGESKNMHRPPVVYFYGIVVSILIQDSVDTMISNNEQYCGGYILANLGFDMWFASFRGSVYSSHIDLTEKDPDYWDYSFDEFALFDIPTVIEYVIQATNYQKVAVLAHSQGTLSMFGSLILKSPELESKVSVYAALSPVFRVDHLAIAGIFKYFFLESTIFDILEKFGVYTIFRRNKILSDALYGICALTPKLCQWVVDLLCSSIVAPYDNLEAYKYLAYHMPNSFTIKNIRQFRQIYQSKGVYMYDFGIPENTRIYGTNKPPMYDLSKIANIPIGLFRERYDRFTTEPDFIYLSDALQERGVLKFSSVYEGGHISLFTGKNTTIFIEAAAFISGYHPWNQSSNE